MGQGPPGVVHDQAGRHDRLRGEPAEEVPGHLPGQLRQRPRGHLRRGAPRRAALDGRRGADLPRGQPAHQAAELLELAHLGGQEDRPRRALPGRGVHPAGDDAPAAQAGFPQELHLFPRAPRAGRARELRARARRKQPLHAAELLRQHPGHPARVAAARWPADVQDPCGAGIADEPTWGVYSGFELFEHVAVRPGSEEYLDSEKYQLRPRDWAGAEASGRSLAPYLRRLNEIRRAHPALQQLRTLHFHPVDNPNLICFSKTDPGSADAVLVVVNLSSHHTQIGTTALDMPVLGLDWSEGFRVTDEITGASYDWGQFNYIELDPYREPAHVFAVTFPRSVQFPPPVS